MGLAHISFTEQGLAHSCNRLMRPFLWPSICRQGLSLHGQALTDLSHHLNSPHIHYIESEMSTSECLEMRMINKGEKKGNWVDKVKKPYEENGTVIQRVMLKPGEFVNPMNGVRSCINMLHWQTSPVFDFHLSTGDKEVKFLLTFIGAAQTCWRPQHEQQGPGRTT